MKKIKSAISILLVFITLFGIMVMPVNAVSFTDVKRGEWYYDAVMWCAEYHVMEGYGNNLFGPNNTMTRAEFAQVLYKATLSFAQREYLVSNDVKAKWVGGSLTGKYHGTQVYKSWEVYNQQLAEDLTLADKACPFFDVYKNQWYTKAINWCYAKGIVTGVTDHMFYPYHTITRQDALVMLERWYFAVTQIYKIEKGTNNPQRIENARKNINDYNYSSKIPDSNPNNIANGLAFNKETYNTKKQAVFTVFTDVNQISGYAIPAVVWAVTSDKLREYAGFINGVGEYNVGPRYSMTRAQMATIMYRLFVDFVPNYEPWWR